MRVLRRIHLSEFEKKKKKYQEVQASKQGMDLLLTK